MSSLPAALYTHGAFMSVDSYVLIEAQLAPPHFRRRIPQPCNLHDVLVYSGARNVTYKYALRTRPPIQTRPKNTPFSPIWFVFSNIQELRQNRSVQRLQHASEGVRPSRRYGMYVGQCTCQYATLNTSSAPAIESSHAPFPSRTPALQQLHWIISFDRVRQCQVQRPEPLYAYTHMHTSICSIGSFLYTTTQSAAFICCVITSPIHSLALFSLLRLLRQPLPRAPLHPAPP